METRFTARPWSPCIEPGCDAGCGCFYGPSSQLLGRAYSTFDATLFNVDPALFVGAEEMEANTHLLAAAPDLFAALTTAVGALRAYEEDGNAPVLARDVADKAEAVLAKAAGQLA